MTQHKPLPLRLRAELFTQLAQMETAGLPTDRAFTVLQVANVAAPRLVAIRQLMKRHPLATAGEMSGLFTKLEARLIHASMIAGSPARIYRRLADFYTDRAMQVATMKSQMVMPVAVFLLALVIQPLPGLVSGTLGLLGYLFQVCLPLIVITIVVFAVRWWLAQNKHRPSPLLSLPIIGKLIIRQNVRDFFESLGLLLEAGVSMLDALPIALETIEVPIVKREFARIAPRVTAGSPFAEAIADLAYLGNNVSRDRVAAFVHTGEASGGLSEMLLRHAALETSAINDWMAQLAIWAPRILYGFVMLWMIVSLLTGGGFSSRVPLDLTS
jgi:type II secretory pathway component PulF